MEYQVRRRRRPALSCVLCRRRKIKCDRIDPCAHCVAVKAQCTYQTHSIVSAADQRGGVSIGRSSIPSPPTYAPTPLSPVQKAHSNRPTAELTVAGNGFASHIGRSSTQLADVECHEPDLRSLLSRMQRLEGILANNPDSGAAKTNSVGALDQLNLQDSSVTLNKTRVMRWSLSMGNAPEFTEIFAIYSKALGGREEPTFSDAQIESRVNELGDLLHKCKHVARALKLGRPSRCLLSPDYGLTMPSREVADRMIALYFRCFESSYRVLHIPTFWADYETFSEHWETSPMQFRLQVLLVIAIGSSLYERESADSELRGMAHQWVYAAQMWLSGPLEKDRLNIAGLQIYCLTILAREVLSIGGDLVFMSMGSLVHRAMQMGLHRDPIHLPPMSILQAEMRRRLWATILEMLVQSSLDSALPPRMSLGDFDTGAPGNIDDNDIDESTKALQPLPKDTYTTSSIQLALMDSLPTRLRIVQLLNGLHNELSYAEVLALNSSINNACREHSIFARITEESGVTAFHRNLLDYLVRRFIIPLHCPFASKSKTNPEFYFSRKASLDAAMAILSPEPDQDYLRLMAVGGGGYREGIRCAGTALSLEFLSHVEDQRLDGTLQRNPQYRQLLKGVLEDLLSLSTERIQAGETNIKMHTFLCMILAQAEAIQEDVPCEPKVTQAAKDSLELCLGLLNQRTSVVPLLSLIDTESLDSVPESYGLDFDLDFFFANPSPA